MKVPQRFYLISLSVSNWRHAYLRSDVPYFFGAGKKTGTPEKQFYKSLQKKVDIPTDLPPRNPSWEADRIFLHTLRKEYIMELNHGTKFISSAERVLETHGNAVDPADIVQKVTSRKNT